MKPLRFLLVPLMLLACLPAHAGNPAQPEVIDLATLKCKDFLESGKENIGLILMWLDGYYTDEEDPAIIDFGKMKTKSERLANYCAQNPNVGLMSAAEDIIGN